MKLDKRAAMRFAEAMSQECRRNATYLRVPGYPKPYYLSYLLRDAQTMHLWGRLGNLNNASNAKGCCCCGGNELSKSREINVNALTYALLH